MRPAARRSRAGRRGRRVVFSLVVAIASAIGSGALGADLVLVRGAALPSGLPERLAPLFSPEGYLVSGGAGVRLEFWLPLEVPSREPSGDNFNVMFPNLPPGALVGLVRVHEPWSDYRKQPIKPGVYTLRFGVQPADGDHMGQTYFRDFLMLVPADLDTWDAAGVAEILPVVEAAKGSSGTAHPGVAALYQIYTEVTETSLVENDYGEPTFAVVTGGKFILGIVVEGHGQELQVRLPGRAAPPAAIATAPAGPSIARPRR